MTFVQRFAIVEHMKTTPSVTLSGKYQLVIPKAARKEMNLGAPSGQKFRVERANKDEIVFRREPEIEDFLGKYGHFFPPNAAAALRKMRDEDWD